MFPNQIVSALLISPCFSAFHAIFIVPRLISLQVGTLQERKH